MPPIHRPNPEPQTAVSDGQETRPWPRRPNARPQRSPSSQAQASATSARADAASRAWPTAWSGGHRRARIPRSTSPPAPSRTSATTRPSGSSRWARPRTSGSCSTSTRPRATCRRCSWPAASKKLIDQGKTTSLRGMFYMLKHTIEGTSEETFDDQDESDPIIEDLEVDDQRAPRGAARLRRETRRRWSARSPLIDSGDTIDCTRMGSGGYSIPSIVEPEVIQFKQVQREVHPPRRKGHGLAAVQRGQVLAASTTASSPTAAASRRAACAGSSTACTTS